MTSSADGVNQGIPSARSVDHLGLNVADLDASICFFTEVLGAELLFRAGPFEDPESDWMTVHFGVPARARGYLAMLRFGPSTNIELVSFDAPGLSRTEPGDGDVGSAHLAIYVDDIDAARHYLAEQPGVRLLGEPTVLGGDLPHAGTTVLFVATPIGVRLELISRAGPLPYEKTTDARLVGPAASWNAATPTEN